MVKQKEGCGFESRFSEQKLVYFSPPILIFSGGCGFESLTIFSRKITIQGSLVINSAFDDHKARMAKVFPNSYIREEREKINLGRAGFEPGLLASNP